MSGWQTYRGPEYAPVLGAAEACGGAHGCQLAVARALLDRAAEALRQGRREHMSGALWCDPGGHAFSERDPGRQRITVNELDDETGEDVTDFRDYCGYHAEQAGLRRRKTRPDNVDRPGLPPGAPQDGIQHWTPQPVPDRPQA